jgi:hypothetical protein
MRPLQFGGPVMQTSLHWAWAGPVKRHTVNFIIIEITMEKNPNPAYLHA